LLAWASERARRVRELKQSALAPLLSKRVVRDVAARAPHGELSPELLLDARTPDVEDYRVTFGRWGEPDQRHWCPCCDQTSRPGLNLVLHLNFPQSHLGPCFALVAPHGREELHDEHPWIFGGHPTDKHELTLAWARIDIAFDSSEALIEEIQSDWVRGAKAEAHRLARLGPDELTRAEPRHLPPEVGVYHVLSYVEHVLAPHARMWAEATLAAALWLLREQLGIRRIFYNTWETGAHMKELESGRPPRSLYTDLPRQFCFQRTRTRPAVLRRSRDPRVKAKLAQRGLEWFVLEC
jgi:hypothetical protein